MTDRPQDAQDPEEVLTVWLERLSVALEIDPAAVDSAALLRLAGTVAHRVVRPAAPVTTYIAGVIVGRAIERGEDPATALRTAVRRIEELTPPGPSA